MITTHHSHFALSLCTLAVVWTMMAPVSAVDLRSQGDPIVSGTGPDMTARWNNVGTIDGQSIDLSARIAAYTGTPSYVFATDSDDFKFQFIEGTKGEVRTATLIWTFYKSGTNDPVTVSNLAFTVDDLDDSSRHEALSTNDAYNFTVNSPTEISASKSGSTVAASGALGISHNPGEPEGAVKLLFSDKSTLAITYSTEFDGADRSAFHHDGDGDFVFDNNGSRLRYTYSFTNDSNIDVEVRLFDSLPEGLVWDTDSPIHISGNLSDHDVAFSNGNRDATIKKLKIRPGGGTVTLTTLATTVEGTITNGASIEPKEKNMPALESSAEISLPDHKK